MAELKSCPFCRSRDISFGYGDIDCNLNPFDPYIRCGNCGIEIHFTAMDRNIRSLQELNTIWNKRAEW